MGSTGIRRGSTRFDPRLWGLAAMLATLMISSSTITPFQRLSYSGTFIGDFAAWSLAAGLATSIVFIAWNSSLSLLQHRRFVLGGLLTEVAGMVVFLLLAYGRIASSLAPVVLGGIATGVGSFFTCLIWLNLYARLDLKSALLNVAISMSLCAVINWLLDTMDLAWCAPVFGVLVVVSLAIPLGCGALEFDGRDEPSFEGTWPIFKNMGSVAFSPLLGLLIYAFVMGAWRNEIVLSYSVQCAGFLVAGGCIVPFFFLRFDRPMLPFIYQVFLPCVAIVALCVSYLQGLESFGMWTTMGIFILYGIVGILSLAAIAAIAHAAEFSVGFITSLSYGLFVGISLLGLACVNLIPWIANNTMTVLVVVSVLYFAYLAVSPNLIAWLSVEGKDATENLPAPEKSLAERSDEVAGSYSLSPRETEILRYLGRGHTSRFIADTLLISDNTARTHIKNIYRKLGVTSREGLYQLIDSNT